MFGEAEVEVFLLAFLDGLPLGAELAIGAALLVGENSLPSSGVQG